MKNKEYLNEEWYQNVKKKISRISLIVLIVGILIGSGLIVTGVIKQNNAKKTNEERYEAAYRESEKNVAAAKERLEAIETEVKELNTKIGKLEDEENSLNMMDPDWFKNSSKYEREISDLRKQVGTLESEKFQLENADYTIYYDKVLPIKYILFYILGAGVIGVTCIIAFSVYIITKRREIAAFTTQQVMPLAQEGIEKMAPTVGNVAKEITKGIKDGLNDKE